ncbi:hypothetical protein Hanom_Chr12g01137701 [Helianthus anomalus]
MRVQVQNTSPVLNLHSGEVVYNKCFCEGSSSTASRKRGLATRQRGGPAQQELVQQPEYVRVVEYIGLGVPHGQSTRLLDSPLLQFELDSGESQRLTTLYTVDLLPFRRID